MPTIKGTVTIEYDYEKPDFRNPGGGLDVTIVVDVPELNIKDADFNSATAINIENTIWDQCEARRRGVTA